MLQNHTDQDPPTYLHYSIGWKVTLKGRALTRDTEPDVVLAPSCYWQRRLKAQVGPFAEEIQQGSEHRRSNGSRAAAKAIVWCSRAAKAMKVCSR